eukprot:Skav231838  [mRNA]  locus=scaffold2215:134663:135369:+ [translate_table: standard]
MDCQVTDWTDWSSCTKSCGGGKSKRSRNEMRLRLDTRRDVFDKRHSEYVKPPNRTESLLGLLELFSAAWGYEKKLNLRCDKGSLGADAGKTPAEAEAFCSADDDCEALYDQGCNGVLRVPGLQA